MLNNTMFAEYSKAFAVQRRSLEALCLREVMAKKGKLKIGYLWEFIKLAFGVGVFLAIRTFFGVKDPPGMPLMIFLLVGFVAWGIFSESVNKAVVTVKSNKAILGYPQVTQLDLHMAGTVVTWVTQVLMMIMFGSAIYLAGYKFVIQDSITFFWAFIGFGAFTLGVATIVAALKAYFPIVENLTPMIMRILFFTSGVFFSPSLFSKYVGDALMWSPIVCYIELIRGTFTSNTPAMDAKVSYLVSVTFATLFFGLLLERHVRKITEQL